MTKKLIAFFLALTFVLAMAAACGSRETQAPSAPSAAAGSLVTDPGALPITTRTDITLTLGIRQAARVADYVDNDYTKRIEEETGVKLNFELFPTAVAESTQKLELMVSANQKIPDILVNLGLTAAARENYGKQGHIIDLRGLLDELSYYWKSQTEKWCDASEQENIIKLGLTSDGKLYGFPFYYADPTDPQATGLWLNIDWMDKLGLNMPKTTDDFYDLLVAFRDGDPNGNGRADEIPYVGSTGWVSDPIRQLMSAFIYWNPTYHFNVENGKLYAPYVTEDFREGLRYIHKLVSEGLLSELSFTQTSADHRAMTDLAEDQDTIVGAFTAHPHLMFAQTNPKRMEFSYIESPLTGPKGIGYVPKDISAPYYNVFVSGAYEYPELAVRFLDSLCKEELSITCRYGKQIDEWTYDVDPAAEPGYTSTRGIIHFISANRLINEPAQTGNWADWATMHLPPTLFSAQPKRVFDNPVNQYYNDNWQMSVPTRMDKNPKELVPVLNYTSDEMDEINEIMTTINTYYQECATLFATGVMDLEKDWDRYVLELESIGLSRYLEVAQQCFDRMNSL